MSGFNKFIINKKNKTTKIKNNLNFINIKFLYDLTRDSLAYFYLDYIIVIFKSINDILYLIYSTKTKYIISYTLINNKIINEIKYV